MKRFVFFFLLAIFFSACVHNNPRPVWLQINSWNLASNPDVTALDPGDLTENFTDVWVYANEKLIGVFEIPCKIPVLVSGNSKIRLYPTVRNNGISATKKIYPFCESYEVTMDLQQGQTYEINPVTYYKTSCKFWYEGFNDSGIQLDAVTPDNVMEYGNDPTISLTGGYGHVHMNDSDKSLWEAATSGDMVLPKDGAEVYMEFDYRTDNTIETSVIAQSSSTGTVINPNVGVNGQPTASMTWRKIYVDLKEIVSYSLSAQSFKQYFKAIIDGGETSGDIYIDNIRVVHF